MAKQIAVVFDFNNIFFRSLSTLSYTHQGFTFKTDEEINSLMGKISTDIAYLLRMFNPNKVMFAVDSRHSWRKDVLPSYKQSRTKNENLCWEKIYKALDSFKNHLKNLGYIMLETQNAEGDDIIALVKETIFEETEFADTNLIIISADADIRQLIDFKPFSNQYCMVFNEIGKGPGGKRHLYCNKAGLEWYENSDSTVPNNIFNVSAVDQDKQYIKNILEMNKKIEIEATDPENILLSKVFCGDDGDDVPAFWEWFSDKGKKVRITNSKFVKILASLEANDISVIDAKKKQLQPVIESVCNRKVKDINVEERLERQEKLVQLSSNKFPKKIKDYKSEIKPLILNQKPANYNSINMKDIIEGSDFKEVLTVKNKAKDADVFKDINKYIDTHALTPLF